MSVSQDQRFTRVRPCPICGGWDQAARGKAIRCWGFLSDDGQFAHCTRVEHAGQLPENAGSGGYAHRLDGGCGCDQRHSPEPAVAKPLPREQREIVAVYDYGDFEVVRFEPKGFAQRRKDGRWGLGDVQPHLYRRMELLTAPADAPVWLPEGEKDAERLRSKGLTATTNPMGAGKWRDTYSADLAGHPVIILADADPPGRRHAQQVAAALKPLAASVKVLELPGPAKDVSDWLGAGHTIVELQAITDSMPLWKPAPPSLNGRRPDVPEGQADTEHYTDLGLARRLVKLHGQDMRYCWPWSKWLTWTGTGWEPDDMGRVVAWCKNTVKGIYADAQHTYVEATQFAASDNFDLLKGKGNPAKEKADALYAWAVRSEAAARISAAVDLARSEPGIPVTPEQFDADHWLLNVENGTLDLKIGQLREHRREDLITKLAPVQYDPTAKFDLWDTFLTQALPDATLRRFLQKAAGSCLTGEAPDDVLIFLYGPGGAGKGSFTGALLGALGDYATTTELETFAPDRNSHGPRPDLAALRGKRMVVVEEVDDRQAGVVAMLKKASGGTSISTRSHYQETFTFKPQFKLWLLGNKRPRFPDDDTGLWRRLRVGPFTHVFVNPDRTIRATLSTAAIAGAAVLAWAMEGCLLWQKEGLGDPPKIVQDATGEYRDDLDPLKGWLEDSIIPLANTWTPSSELYESYKTWARKMGVEVRDQLKATSFGKRLAEKFEPDRRGKHRIRGYKGVALLTGSQLEADALNASAKAEPLVNSLITPFMGDEQEPQIEADGLNASANVSAEPSAVSLCERCRQPVAPHDVYLYTAGGGVECKTCAEAAGQ